MIQRIQTIWLLLAEFCAALLYVFNLWEAPPGYSAQYISTSIADNSILMVLWVTILIAQLIAIFLFRRRPLQLRLCNLSIIAWLLFLMVAAIQLQYANAFTQFDISNFKPGIILPFAGIVFVGLAKRSIRRDENLVSSMNRLR